MTWLSDRSGIASIGVDVSAHHPQPARTRYTTTTMNRFLNATSMSRLIMSHNTRHAARVHARTYAPGRGVRADTRQLRRLNEEDREKDVLGHRRDGYRRRRTPGVTENESRDIGGQDNPDAEHRRSNGDHKGGTGLVGTLALC